MKLDILLSQSQIEALAARSMQAVVTEAIRHYLKRHTGKDKPLPYSNLAGRDNYQPDEKVGTLVWELPPDIGNLLPSNGETEAHCRAAIVEYLRPPASKPLPKPLPPTPRAELEIPVRCSVLDAAKAQAVKEGVGLEVVLERACIAYSRKILDECGKPKLIMCRLVQPSADESVVEIRWRVPSSVLAISGPDERTAACFISESIDRTWSEVYS